MNNQNNHTNHASNDTRTGTTNCTGPNNSVQTGPGKGNKKNSKAQNTSKEHGTC